MVNFQHLPISATKPIDAASAIFLAWRGDESRMKSAISPNNPRGDALYEGPATAANRKPAKGLALSTSGTHDPFGTSFNCFQILVKL
jgi:hypothetical protein